MTTKFVRFGDWKNGNFRKEIPVNGIEELRRIVKIEQIEISKKTKLGTIWGRKWVDYLGQCKGEKVYLVDEGLSKP